LVDRETDFLLLVPSAVEAFPDFPFPDLRGGEEEGRKEGKGVTPIRNVC
jgi:hypothetical protein